MIAAAELLLRVAAQTVDELQMIVNHPLGGALLADAAEELESRAHRNHHATIEMGLEPRHEELLLRSAERDPDNFRLILLDHAGDGLIIKILHITERKFDKLHVLHIRIVSDEIALQRIKNILLSAQENHPIFARGYDVVENLASAVLLIPDAIKKTDIERHITAVADREHTSVHDSEVIVMSVGGVENYPVSYADVVGARFQESGTYSLHDGPLVELVIDLEICLH